MTEPRDGGFGIRMETDRQSYAAGEDPLASAAALRGRGPELVEEMDASTVLFGRATKLAPGLSLALDELELSGRPDAVRRIYCLTDGELPAVTPCLALLPSLRSAAADLHLYGFGDGFDVT